MSTASIPEVDDLTQDFHMTPEQARSILSRTAGTIAQKAGVSVEYTTDGSAFTDGTTIHLPPPKLTDHKAWAETRGYVDHESAHILYTYFPAKDGLDKLEAHVLNILEDTRINELLRRTYPGCRDNLNQLYRSIVEMGNEQAKEAKANNIPDNRPDGFKKLGALQVELENLSQFGMDKDFFGTEADKFAAQYAPEAKQVISDAKTTLDLVELSKKLAALVRDPNSPPEPQDQQQGQGEGDEGDGEDESAGDQSEQNSKGGKNGNKKRKPVKPKKQSAESFLDQLAKQLIKAHKESGQDTYSHRDRLREPTFVNWTQCRSYSKQHLHRDAQASMPQAMQLGAGLRENLKQALKAQTLARTTRDQPYGNLDMGKLATIAAKVIDPSIYTKTTMGKAVNTAIHILLDASGSMEDHAGKWLNSVSAATILADAAVGCGAVVRLSSFDDEVEAPVWLDYGEKPTRYQWLDRMPCLHPSGGTPTGQHIQVCARDLLKRPERRKILVCCTDGAPNDYNLAVRMCQATRASGIELYGVGLGCGVGSGLTDNLRGCFGKSFVAINKMDELRNALLNLLTRLLLHETGKAI